MKENGSDETYRIYNPFFNFLETYYPNDLLCPVKGLLQDVYLKYIILGIKQGLKNGQIYINWAWKNSRSKSDATGKIDSNREAVIVNVKETFYRDLWKIPEGKLEDNVLQLAINTYMLYAQLDNKKEERINFFRLKRTTNEEL